MTLFPEEVRALRSAPHDEALRLAIAQRLEDVDAARAEFIRLQCELARIVEPPPEPHEAYDQERETRRLIGPPAQQALEDRLAPLYEAHASAWRREIGLEDEGLFVRGFVELVAFTAARFATAFETVMARSPVRALRLEIASTSESAPDPRFGRVPPNTIGAALDTPALELIESFDVAMNRLGDAAAIAIAAAPWSSLETLDLDENLIGDDGARALAAARFPRLRRLRLRDNRFEGGGVLEVLRAPWFARLEVLDLGWNAGGASIESLGALETPTNLRVLNLTNTRVGDAGALAIARAAHRLPLRGLFLNGAGLTDAGVEVLVTSGGFGPLLTLDLGRNTITDRAAGLLGSAATTTLRMLTALDVRETRIGASGERLLRDAFEGRGVRLVF